jgi:histidine phosphotransferase ChpT
MAHDTDTIEAMALAERLVTRMCHDLSGQINALTGGLEVGAEAGPTGDAEAWAVINDAAAMLSRRLKLFRAAWGIEGADLAATDLPAYVAGLPGRRLALDVSNLAPHSFTAKAGRLVLNVLLLAAESLPMGGVLTLAGDPRHDVVVTLDGPRAAWPAGLAQMFVDPLAAVRAFNAASGVAGVRTLQAPLTAMIAHRAGMRASFLMAPAIETVPPLLLTLATHH